MTTADLVFLGGQFNFVVDRDSKIVQAHFVGRVGVKAPDGVPTEFKGTIEEKRTESVEVKISKGSTLLNSALPSLVTMVMDKALERLVPPVAGQDAGGVVL